MLAKIKSKFLLLMKPIQILMQRLGASEKIITARQVTHIGALANPGDILLSYEAQRFTSMFIPGKWDHAAIITDQLDVMEAVGDQWVHYGPDGSYNKGGVREVGLIEWLYKKDHVCLIRPLYEDNTPLEASKNAIKYKGLGYDYGFNIDNETIYCSELVYLCYQKVDPQFMYHIDREIYPNDYLKECLIKDARFIVVYNTRESSV